MQAKQLIKQIYDDYGVKINFNKPKNYNNFKVSLLDKQYHDKIISVLIPALKKYNKEFLSKYLKTIYFCKKLIYEPCGLGYGGTMDLKYSSIIIKIDEIYINVRWIHEVMHHELSHLLFFKNEEFKEQWKKCNDKNFEYGDGGFYALKNKNDNLMHNVKSFKRGVVCQYGESDIIEDIATFVEYVMTNKKDFERRALKHSIIKKKYKLLKSFYKKLGVQI